MDLFIGRCRYADFARSGRPLKTCRDVDTVPMNVGLVDDDVADVDANPKDDPLVLWNFGIPSQHAVLNYHRAGHCIHDARELNEDAIAGRLYDAAVMGGDSRVGEFSADGLEGTQGSDLVNAREAAIANDVTYEDCGQPSFDAPVTDYGLSRRIGLRHVGLRGELDAWTAQCLGA